MLVSEVISLAKWVQENIQKARISEKYANLSNKLQQNINGNQTPFEEERNELGRTLQAIQLNSLSDAQIRVLEDIGVRHAIANEGVNTLEEIFVRNVLDISTTKQKLDEQRQSIDHSTSWANSVQTALFEYFDENESEINSEYEEVVVRVRFTKEAGINHVTDLKEWSSVWYDILRGFALANNKSPEEFRFVGATSGSVIAMFAGDPATVAALVLTIERGLAFANSIFELKANIRNLNNSTFDTKEAVASLNQSLEKEKQKAPDEIVAQIMREAEENTIDGEKRAALKIAVQKLLNFLEKGGEVDFVVPDEIEQNDEPTDVDFEEAFKQLSEIRSTVERIRETERDIKRLEDLSKD